MAQETGSDPAFAAWLVYPNFCAIMGYNPAFNYALSIGLLSDLIGGD